MIHTDDRISLFHVILLLIMTTGLVNHVTIIPALLDVAGRDAWISVILAMVACCLWVWLIYYIARGTGQQNIYQWMKENLGTLVAQGFVFIVCLFLFASITVTLTDLGAWTHITYLRITPQLVIVLTFIIICCLAASSNILTLTVTNGILLPIVIALGYFVFSANLPEKDYSLLFPVMEDGFTPVWQGMIYSAAGLVEVFVIILLQHHLKTSVHYGYLVILVIILAYLTFGPVTGGIAAFGPDEASMQRFPAYELWSLVSLGRFIEHVDFFSIYQWLSGAFIRISLGLFIIVDIFNVHKGWKRVITLMVLSVVALIFASMPFSDMQFVHFLSHFFLPLTLVFMVSCSVFLALCVFIANHKKTQGRGIRQ